MGSVMTIGLKIKPLSVNGCWQGRRFKTPKYKKYEKDVMAMLPDIVIPATDLKLTIEWGFSSAASDIDNPLKPFIDILQKKYGFNDSKVHELHVKKKKCKKGAEYILFSIVELVQ